MSGDVVQDPVTELVRNAIGCGVMMALENRDELIRKLRSLPADGTLADALTQDAESFVRYRTDLIEDVAEKYRRHFDVGPDDEYRGQ